ncbi:MAG: TetR/AcrR family transcriptional regulator [Polyangiales bacterium]
MARPREFDEDEVLERALGLFWSRGYDATSVQDLVDATGLSRASLYGAFGDKDALFRKVLDRYVERASPLGALDRSLPAPEALRALVRAWVDGACDARGPRGCFLLLTATSSNDATSAQQILAASVADTERKLAAYLRERRAAGELPEGRDPKDLARLLVVTQHGVASMARAGVDRALLRAASKEALAHVLGDA